MIDLRQTKDGWASSHTRLSVIEFNLRLLPAAAQADAEETDEE